MPLTFIQFVIHIGIHTESVLDHRLIKVNLQKEQYVYFQRAAMAKERTIQYCDHDLACLIEC